MRGGKVAGNTNHAGYVRIGLGGAKSNSYMAHRLAWLYMTGEWPVADIDHINGKRSDNRWVNLRSVSRSVNLQNQRVARSNNNTGLLGVTRTRGGFGAQIAAYGEQRWIGTFQTPEAAHAAYIAAKRVLHEGNTL